MQNFFPKYINGYSLGKKLGSGTSGSVYLLTKPNNPERCCKIVQKTSLPTELDQRLFQNEVKALSSLIHPNISRYYDLIEDDNNYYLVEEFCLGTTLQKQILKYGSLSEPVIKKIAHQLFYVLEYIHSKGVVYRDIKPDNILVDINNNIKLIDFGLSTTDTSALRSTFCGTLAYSAPECIKHNPYLANKADIWSAGIILYQMITGNFPWSQIQNIPKLCHEITSTIVQIPPDINPYLANVIELALRHSPSLRPAASDILMMPFFKDPKKTPRLRQTFGYSCSTNNSCPQFQTNLGQKNDFVYSLSHPKYSFSDSFTKPSSPKVIKIQKPQIQRRKAHSSPLHPQISHPCSPSPLVD